MTAVGRSMKKNYESLVFDLQPEGIDCIPMFCRNNFHAVRPGTELHTHPGCVEICLCQKGNLRFESPDQEYPFTPGRVFVSNPDELHRLIGGPNGLKMSSIHFKIPPKGKRILGLSADETRWIVYGLTHFPVRLFPASERVKRAFERIVELYVSTDLDITRRKLSFRAAVLELLLSVIEAPSLPPAKDDHPDPRVVKIVRRMRHDPCKNYMVESLASEAGLSPVAFSQIFKRAAGLPPHAFLLSCRLEQARNDLAKGNANVAKVAQHYCFASSKHFTTAFRKMFGICPREYIKGFK